MERLAQVPEPAERPTFGSASQLMSSPGLAPTLGAPGCPGPLQVVTAEADLLCGCGPSGPKPAPTHSVSTWWGQCPLLPVPPQSCKGAAKGEGAWWRVGCPGSGGGRWKEESSCGSWGQSAPVLVVSSILLSWGNFVLIDFCISRKVAKAAHTCPGFFTQVLDWVHAGPLLLTALCSCTTSLRSLEPCALDGH